VLAFIPADSIQSRWRRRGCGRVAAKQRGPTGVPLAGETDNRKVGWALPTARLKEVWAQPTWVKPKEI